VAAQEIGGKTMICPYNGFKECDWENCPARMYMRNPVQPGYVMKVCAIAYNGGGAPIPQKEGETNARE
jgi:hypothetical protein